MCTVRAHVERWSDGDLVEHQIESHVERGVLINKLLELLDDRMHLVVVLSRATIVLTGSFWIYPTL